MSGIDVDYLTGMAANKRNIGQLLQSARMLEKDNNLAEAESLYLDIIKTDPSNTDAYSRLMIIYRKQKEYRKELSIINKAIKTHEDNLRQEQKQWISANKKAARLSKNLATSLGLLTKKGLPVYEDKLVETWRKRKDLVAKKVAKFSNG